ncbi:MerR family transcriptional regulator [Phenylobacterium sp. SCN 70-31]|uniref:MerR family transcriptional regulator n=1 Tax=Phenylobacterium sp. SCN 70-31 TaxID=1660129 RepID=UPI0025EE4152|nr:MerR family transcriptional regulator [Phenylobacterium sp. SCN 70-31]
MISPNVQHFPRLKIGDAMRLFGVTARALRQYEAEGLIVACRDRFNVRYYDAATRRRIFWIVRLRGAGLPLCAIREALAVEGDNQLAAHAVDKLIPRRAELAEQLAHLDRLLADLSGTAGEIATEQWTSQARSPGALF